MPVLATPVGNAYNHVSYLVACHETGEALAVDPFHVELTLEIARTHDLRITQIVNTHEHWDHAGRNAEVKAATGAQVLVPKGAIGVLEQYDRTLSEGDVVQVGSSHSLRVLDTPGHTMTHVSLFAAEEDVPFLLCGDTLFGAGVGNCGFGGHVGTLFETVQRLKAMLPAETILYPGHDYLARNLDFILHIDPANEAAKWLRSKAEGQIHFTTVKQESEINPFFRLDRYLSICGEWSASDDSCIDFARFAALRKARDRW